MGLVSEGRDTYCLDTLSPGRFARGVQLVAQRCYHRLTTPSGTLRGGEEEANFGLDLASYVGSTDPAEVGNSLPVVVQNELLKDPAVDAVTVTASRVDSGGEVSWSLVVRVQSTAGDVDLILSVSAVSVELIGVS